MATVQVQTIRYCHANPRKELFGGQHMSWIDVIAGAEVRRYTRHTSITTASVERMDFLASAYVGDLIRLEATTTWTGRTSVEVLVNTYVEDYCSENPNDQLIHQAVLIFVALDKEEKPCPVRPFVPTTPEEQERWNQGEARAVYRRGLRRGK